MNHFSELNLNPALHRNLASNLFVQPTPVQAKAIPPALAGSDVVATAPTGTGKTVAFVLPILERLLTPASGAAKSSPIRALILSPTRELALQISSTFAALSAGTNLRAAVVVGGLSEQTQLNTLRRGASVVIGTPGRLEDFVKRGLIDLTAIEIVVLDEADRMLDMGFLPAIERILGRLPAKRQTLFFSATMDKSVEHLPQRHSHQPVRISVSNSVTKAPEKIDLHLYEVENDRKLGLLQHMLGQSEGSFLVFVRTKHGTDRLAKRLSRLSVRAVAIHGDRTQNQRNQALAGFRDGRYRVLVATDVAARGIHVDSIEHVINFDLPQSPEDFIHRVGRTGRAGQRGTASTFSSKSERGEIRRIERECKLRMEKQEVSRQIASDQELMAALPELTTNHHFPTPRAHHHEPIFSKHGRGAAKASSRKQFGRQKARGAAVTQ